MEAEIIRSNSTSYLMARPIDVVPEVQQKFVEGLAKHAEGLVISDPAGFKEAAELLNNATKTFSVLNARRLEMASKYDEAKDREVNSVSKPFLDALKATKEKVSELMEVWDRKEREEIARQALARRQLLADAQRLTQEADKRQEQAALAVEASTTDAEFNQAAQAFDKGVSYQTAAQETTLTVMAENLPDLTKARGVKDKMEVRDLKVTDLGALDLNYHMADEAKIKRHILDGTLKANTPGITFVLGKKFSGSGR